jgi:signal transduction histidine kinase
MNFRLTAESLERLGAVLNDLPDAVRLIAADGSVILRNEASRKLAPNGLGHLCGGENGGRDSSCPACQLETVLVTGTLARWHVVVPRPGAASDYFEVTLSPVAGKDGKVGAVLEILRDATATLGLEQYLIGMAESRDQELSELRRSQTEILYRDRLLALSRLVAGLSHEIHTPLGAMLSSADLLQRAVGRLEEAAREIAEVTHSDRIISKLGSLKSSAEVMVEGARRIHAVVRTLRLFTRLDEAPRKSVDLHEGLETSLELLQYRISSRTLVVRDYAKLPEVLCRPDALNQVFMNLLLNAVQAVDGDGEIRIATRMDGSDAVIEIADDGPGIPADDHSRIFDLGFTTRGGRGGTGIGLALSRRIVQEHRGSIEVASEPGKGSTFVVRIPVGSSDPEVG